MMVADTWIEPEDPLTLRRALGCFATGITIVTGQSTAGTPFGLTASSFQSVSLSPPLILFSIKRGAMSIDLIQECRSFCVNVLREDQEHIAKRFASPIPDRFAGVDWHAGPRGNPILHGAITALECRLWATHDAGDHVIVIGLVTNLRYHLDHPPLVFFRGEFRSLAQISQEGQAS